MSGTLIIAIAFIGAAALAGGVIALFFSGTASQVESRLDLLTATGPNNKKLNEPGSILVSPLDATTNPIVDFFGQLGSFDDFLAQSDLSISVGKFMALTAGAAGLGFLACLFLGAPIALTPIGAVVAGVLPFLFVVLARRRRLSNFGRQLPEALELMSRALRSGHSLGAGISLVADEMADPIRKEFGRCYEEQNLGVPLEEALEGMTRRVPNLDLRFFCTAVILQRQTGGDLAEILDKIGHLIRERFKIWGQIQALTGEGRLSGIVLLALPPVLFVVMYRLNPTYVMMLFTDELGQKMLAVAIVMQLLGAVVIKKIVNIKV